MEDNGPRYEFRISIRDEGSAIAFLSRLAHDDEFRAEVEGATSFTYEGVSFEISSPPGAAPATPLQLPSKEEIEEILGETDEPFGHVERRPLGHIWLLVLPFRGGASSAPEE